MALVYRAYFAFSNNHRVNSKGLNTSAIFGFTMTLLELLRKEKPTHLAVVFDTPAPTARHIEFEAYKAHREAMPEDLSKAIPYIYRLVEGFNIPLISMDGFEADDIIGTLAKEAEHHGFITFMMTPDKDFGQLVSDTTFMYKPARMGNGAEIMGVPEILKKWDILRIDQVIDILGLMGDQADNISGIPGVGEKTAIQLVKDFDNIENLLKNTNKLKGKLKEKVELNADKAILSKKLATIICDVPVTFDEKALERKELNREALKELFTELEFRRLAEQVLGESISLSEAEAALPESAHAPDQELQPQAFRTIQNVPHKYHLVQTAEERKELIALMSLEKTICFDTETTGLDANNAELVGLSFSWKAHEAWYVTVPAKFHEAQLLADEFKSLFENEAILKIGQNIKYDMSVLRWYGIEVKGKLFDTMLAHFLIQPETRHNMNALAESYLNYSPVHIENLIGKKGKDQLSMRDVPLEQLVEYAAEDADVTLQLEGKFAPLLAETNTTKLFEEVDVPLIPVLSAMEAEGIRLDSGTLNQISAELKIDIAAVETEIQNFAGTPFNVSSPKQVGEVLFEILQIVEKPKKTKTGQYATGEEVLAKLVHKHEIVGKILDYRELVKLKNTYVDTLPLLINPRTGRIHTSYNQVVAVTGRLSSDNPNLQNIPIRTLRGREIRKAFIPRSDQFVLFSADYSQIELRIMAGLSKDPAMIEAFDKQLDIHTATAAKVYNMGLDAVTGDMRRNAKMVNFGIIYGISAFGLAERLNIPRRDAAAIIDNYFQQYPGVKAYMDQSIENARSKGYVETILGRRRYLRDIQSSNATVRGFAERNAINAPIQGSAADMIKLAMINIHNDFIENKFRSKMLLQVHDELVFDLHKEEIGPVRSIVEHRMKTALDIGVPVEVGMGMGANWLEAH
jgi:DNA polymerase-1